MEVIAYDPYIDPSKATDLDIAYTTNFDDILACDIITIHTPKTEETIGMIGAKEIAKMKDGVILINCARGGLYNEEDVLAGLQSGKIAWLGIDVFEKDIHSLGFWYLDEMASYYTRELKSCITKDALDEIDEVYIFEEKMIIKSNQQCI